MNIYKLNLILAVLLVIFAGCNQKPGGAEEGQSFNINPFIGTGGHGHTYPGATMPFGMVQLSPDTRLTGWDGCSGYHYSDSLIYGFSHTHLQGTGVSDYGDILMMPTNNEVNEGNNWGERYRSTFRKETEKAAAGYYSVHLDDHNLTAELTATERVGIHRYIFDSPDSCVLFADMAHRDELLSYQFEPRGDTMIVGFRQSKAWAEDQLVYFAMTFDAPFEFLDQTYELYEVANDDGSTEQIMEMVPVFPLRFGITDTLQAKVALSSTSIEGALKNLETEAPHWSFDNYRTAAEEAWDKELSRITIEGGSEDDRTIFYTALYHSFTVPNLISDVDGAYRGTDLQPHAGDGRPHYTVYSLWDTFRATHPLYTLVQQERTKHFVSDFLDMHRKGGQLPMWELAANYTGCMIGYHSVPVIVDAAAKGLLPDEDPQAFLDAMIQEANIAELGKTVYAEYGYIPSDFEHESVSKTLEYAYNDWCIARFAESIGNDDVAAEYDERALSYRNLFDPESGFMRPKRGGCFVEYFDPREVNFNFTEANAWQYTFFTPQDVNGHIDLLGGDEGFAAMLDSLFESPSVITGRAQADITGLIGQYAHGNEPSHHLAYLYPFVGQPWKTHALIDSIMSNLYHNAPDGLSGNEDCGQMSSWYVLSALGFYPVTPGSDVYILGTPRFDKATMNLENGKQFTIKANRETEGAIYVSAVTLNGKPLDRTYIRHEEIMAGGELIFDLQSTPDKSFGAAKEMRPTQRVNDANFIAVPAINAPRVFKDSAVMTLDHLRTDVQLEYLLDDGDWQVYAGPVKLSTSTTIRARARSMDREKQSAIISTDVRLLDHNYSITLATKYDNQYHAGGDSALIDGINGGNNFKTGEWQGYYGKNAVAIVDLKEERTVREVTVGALQDIKPWIWAPERIVISLSDNGEVWKKLDELESPLAVDDYTPAVHRFSSNNKGRARYVRIEAINRGTIPEWHLGAGNPSWIFLDEIEIKVD